MKEITVGIPTKNRPFLLERTLVSILAASDMSKVEEVIIYDATEGGEYPPEGVKRIFRIMEQETSIRYVPTTLRLVQMRRQLLEVCRTPYLYTFDDDTVLTKSTFDVYPFDTTYAFICPRMVDLWYTGPQWFSAFPEDNMLLPYQAGSRRVPLKYMDTVAVLFSVAPCLEAGVFEDTRDFSEFLDASVRLHKVGKRGLYEPRSLVYHDVEHGNWRNPTFGPAARRVFSFPEEFNPYIVGEKPH